MGSLLHCNKHFPAIDCIDSIDSIDYIAVMASITIRNLDEETKRRLRMRAAEKGRSMEEEARAALVGLYGSAAPTGGLGTYIHELFKPLGGVELELPSRGSRREPPDFSGPEFGE